MRHGGIIINADSMQVYAELSILTARPPADDTERIPHRLYGHVGAATPYSVAIWLNEVASELAAARSAGAQAIIVGGTGLYFKALLEGLSPVPAIALAVRRRWREAAARAQPGEMHAELARRDAVMAGRLDPGDTQRIVRALEVLEDTGRSLADWQSVPGRPIIEAATATRILVDLPREVLHRRCDQRFLKMMEGGALNEVRALVALGLSRDAPAMRALGVAPLADYVAGALSLEEAVERAKSDTRRYVKRQQTWAKRYMKQWMIHQT